MKTIFVVSRGPYGDYRVEFACATEQAARDAAAKLNALNPGYDPYEVEELPFIDGPDEVGATVQYMTAVESNGNVREWSYTLYGPLADIEDEVFTNGSGYSRAISATPERARKILADKLAQQRAEVELDPQP